VTRALRPNAKCKGARYKKSWPTQPGYPLSCLQHIGVARYGYARGDLPPEHAKSDTEWTNGARQSSGLVGLTETERRKHAIEAQIGASSAASPGLHCGLNGRRSSASRFGPLATAPFSSVRCLRRVLERSSRAGSRDKERIRMKTKIFSAAKRSAARPVLVLIGLR